MGFGGFSKTCAIFFERRLMVCEERLNSLQATTGGGCSAFYGFHRTERDRLSVFLSATDPGAMKKRRFIEIDS